MVEIKLGRGRDELAQRSWRSYFETSQRIRQNLEGSLKDRTGLTVSDYNTLLLLWEEPTHTLTMSALARKLVFSPSRLTYRIRVLEDAGLVTKTECPDDKRAHNVGLTEVGAQAFLDAGRQHRENIDEVFLSHVDDEELEVIERVFARIGKALPD
ncbi:MarR family transcriptional regulator [Brevibacterium sp. CBA3109]|uniref:MarR family transcriptional regulator n=1 Tax=Brevibacterium koreense TaxID=3140787 RepID=A0AAU7UI82_9MICO